MTDKRHDDGSDLRGSVRKRYAEIADAEGGGSCCCSGKSCCAPDALGQPSASVKLGYSAEELDAVPDGANMGLGCGNPQAIAALKPGETVLDLGSGGGFDCFLAAPRVGGSGKVVGVDMTAEMLAKARANAVNGGYDNVEFRLGEIEHLPVPDNFADVVLSNCVINLSPDKPQVYREVFRVLRPGGRVAVSDIVALDELPETVKSNLDAYCGCIAGAVSPEDIEQILRDVGFTHIQVNVKTESREFIRDWMPGSGAENHVASADIRAEKPASD